MNQMKQRQHDAWEAYLAARDRAQNSNDINDGIAAGRAWNKFMECFAVDGAVVIPFRRPERKD